MTPRSNTIALFLFALLAAAGAVAGPKAPKATMPAPEDIPPVYHRVAFEHRMPSEVLYGLALIESKRKVGARMRPWPWTLNFRGRGYYFASREAALDALRMVLAETCNVDIGVAQVNYCAHRERLGSAEQAIDPYRNLSVGAGILAQYWRQTGDLWEAVGRYRSANEKYALPHREAFGRHLVAVLLSRSLPAPAPELASH